MKLVILDRDGVINYDDRGYINHAEDWHPMPGSLEAIARLHQAGYTVTVITNQSGISRGYITEPALAEVHDRMQTMAQAAGGFIDKVYFCPHLPDMGCRCRKPRTGMIEDIAHDFPDTDLKQAHLVGDSWFDILAGKRMSCHTYLVQTGNGRIALNRHAHDLGGTKVVADLNSAADIILAKEKSS